MNEHGRVDWALELNTEEKVDGGKVSAGQRHCQDQRQHQSTGQGACGIEGFGRDTIGSDFNFSVLTICNNISLL